MSIIIFIIILSLLIIVHELGHFLVAKSFGIRVDEFGLGFPPRVRELFTWKGTPFTLNWLPFGGFVKIFGENPTETEMKKELEPSAPQDSFQSKNRGIQASVLVAGVVGNFLFAWALLSFGFVVGLPAPANYYSLPVENVQTMITTVLPDSPAELAGLKSGDVVLSLSREEKFLVNSPEEASNFIAESEVPITFEIVRGDNVSLIAVTPEEGLVSDRLAVGIAMDAMGVVSLPPHRALWYGLKTTSELTVLTGQTIGVFIGQALTGRADISHVTGPVGIVGLVGDARELGFVYLLTFTSLISINLAVINLIPFPALDGGRLLFVSIEALTRRRISPKFFNFANAIGFALLIFLMILITIQDVRNIF